MFRRQLKRFVKEDRAQDLIEYTLLIAFLALVTVGLMSQAGVGLSGIWGGAGATLAQAAGGPSTPTPPATGGGGGGDGGGDHDGH